MNDILYHQVDEELRKKYNDDLAKEKNKYQTQLGTLNNERAAFEKEKIIAQLGTQLKEAQRKAEQGSTQLQGEVQGALPRFEGVRHPHQHRHRHPGQQGR